MSWNAFFTFVGVVIPAMVILDAATIYNLKKIKNFQIAVWYSLSNMKPHYSSSLIVGRMISVVGFVREKCGRLFPIVSFIFACAYVIGSYYGGLEVVNYITGSGAENLFLSMLIGAVKLDGIYPYVVFPIIIVHVIALTASLWVIGYFHRKSLGKNILFRTSSYFLTLFLVCAADISALAFEYSFAMYIFNMLTGGGSREGLAGMITDYYRIYLIIPLTATPFLLAPAFISVIISIFLTVSWVVVFPAKELAERVLYVQASNERQGLFTYLAGFISAVVALIKTIVSAM